jgi:electron transfer flavoprotein alpha subunit
MMDIIVLIKLVPDIRHIPGDAWDLQRGTLRRNRLQLIPNAFDDRALALALQIRDVWRGRVTALSMGPPAAAALCSRALAFGADRAILVSDPACAGSDTLATSAVLARAIERNCDDTSATLILAGMQSPDGDTAQVPVQVAARLGASVVPYVTAARITTARVDLTSISSGGDTRSWITPGELPAVVTCTEQLPSIPFHTSLEQLDRAASTEVQVVTASDLELNPDEVGLAGSATRVVTISVASSVRRESYSIDWTAHGDSPRLALQVVDRLAAALEGDTAASGRHDGPGDSAQPGQATPAPLPPAAPATGSEGSIPGDAGGPGPANAVWAIVGSKPDADRLGIMNHARQVADAMGCPAVACIVGDAESDVTQPDGQTHQTLGAAGATDTLVIAGVGLADPVVLALALEQAVACFTPRVVLLPATPEGRVTAPYLATRLGAGLTADCTSFVVKDYTIRRAGQRKTFHDALHQKRPALGGNIEATIVSPRNIQDGKPQMATVRPGPTVEHPGAQAVRRHRWVAQGSDESTALGAAATAPAPGMDQAAESAARGRATAHIDIERCKVLVSVGRGAGGESGIADYAGPLAEALRRLFNVDVEVSASRMVVDAGHLERDRQVGQTGKTVAPDIYIALGISGSAQHRAGMERSATIISVNVDADAPIRLISDVFVHGRVQDVVPPLIEALNQRSTT